MMTTTRTTKKKRKKKTGISLEIFCLISLLVLCALPASSQSASGNQARATAATRTIEGRVLTDSGSGIPGAIVLLKDNKTLQVRSYIAQADGEYHFFGLSTDVNYTLRAENQELASKQKTVSVFDSHREVKLNLKLTQKIKAPKK